MKKNSTLNSRMIRSPAVAGAFYPAQPSSLRQAVLDYLESAEIKSGKVPKAVIAPHAGYAYSGPIAGSAFKPLINARQIRRVIILGPSHRVAFQGVALSEATGFETPIGVVPVDREAISRLDALPQVRVFEPAHREEHGLEVELPFLQSVLSEFKIVPLVVGNASDEEVGEIVERLWGGPETLFVISSDLSHYYDYDAARKLDGITAQAIERRKPEEIGVEQACGRIPIRGFLWASRKLEMAAQTLDLRNSGDTAGSRERVVGYGAFAFA